MKGLWVLVLCLVCVVEAILVKNGSAYLNETKSDQLITEESQVKRSTAYGGYYPDDFHHGYGYGYDHDHHSVDYHPHHHPHHPHGYDTLKALLVPLAGVALLGAAAIFASNPILLQLGVVQGKRRRRDTAESQLQDLVMLEKFISNLPVAELEEQNRRMLASYMGCAGSCVQRVACEIHRFGDPEDIHVLDMVISEIQNNDYIDGKLKNSIIKARKIGRSKGNCKGYPCIELDKLRNFVKERKL